MGKGVWNGTLNDLTRSLARNLNYLSLKNEGGALSSFSLIRKYSNFSHQ